MKTFRGNTSWLALIGAGFFWGWLDCLVAQGTLFDPFGSLDLVDEAYLLTYAVSALPALVALLLPLRIDRLTTHPAVGPAIGSVGTIGCVLIAGRRCVVFNRRVLDRRRSCGFRARRPVDILGPRLRMSGQHARLRPHYRRLCGQPAYRPVRPLLPPIPSSCISGLCPLISGALFWILARYTDDGKELALGSAQHVRRTGR